MKYIRTKDGIYEVEKKERAYFEGQPLLYYCKSKSSLVEEKNVLNQADTIEELCDIYVIVNKETKQPLPLTPASRWTFDEARAHSIYEESELFACIWVFNSNRVPTLKPVAQLDDKGELELL